MRARRSHTVNRENGSLLSYDSSPECIGTNHADGIRKNDLSELFASKCKSIRDFCDGCSNNDSLNCTSPKTFFSHFSDSIWYLHAVDLFLVKKPLFQLVDSIFTDLRRNDYIGFGAGIICQPDPAARFLFEISAL